MNWLNLWMSKPQLQPLSSRNVSAGLTPADARTLLACDSMPTLILMAPQSKPILGEGNAGRSNLPGMIASDQSPQECR